jgi:hypothetical protein
MSVVMTMTMPVNILLKRLVMTTTTKKKRSLLLIGTGGSLLNVSRVLTFSRFVSMSLLQCKALPIRRQRDTLL